MRFMEEGNHKAGYAFKNYIFDILKYLYMIDPTMTQDEREESLLKISRLHNDLLCEQKRLEVLIKDRMPNTKLNMSYQCICAILVMFNDLIENASISLISEE